MQGFSENNAAALAEEHDSAHELMLPIETFILQGVKNIEAPDPREYSSGQCQECPGGRAPGSGNCQVASDWSNAERRAEPDMRPAGEPLGKAVAEYPGERD